MIPAENLGVPAPKRERPHLILYLFLLFSTAFLLLIMSYFMEQRRSDQQVIDGLQQSMSAMETTQNALEQNQALTEENQSLRDRLSAMEGTLKDAESQQTEQENITLALDWLWRIEREYFQKRYSSARALIQAFEQTGLDAYLPNEALVDPDYRTPKEQYNSIRNLLF